MRLLKNYLDRQIALGRCYFTADNAHRELNISKNAVRLAIARLLVKHEIASPAKGFYVIVTPEYRTLGCLPPEYFIPYLMNYLGHEHYYAGLMTAASFYGAAHQAPQVFQIITKKKYPEFIVCGRVRIELIVNINAQSVPTRQISTPKSRLTVSTPEATAMDLLRFTKQSGGLNHIATILAELKDTIEGEKLKLLIETQKGTAWKQRLGYILELVEAPKLANIIKSFLKKQRRIDYVLLSPHHKRRKAQKRNDVWKIIENTTIESDL